MTRRSIELRTARSVFTKYIVSYKRAIQLSAFFHALGNFSNIERQHKAGQVVGRGKHHLLKSRDLTRDKHRAGNN